MKGKKLSMREVRKILQYRLEHHISASQTASSLRKSKGAVIETMKRFKNSGLTWPLPEALTDSALEELFYPKADHKKRDVPLPDVAYIHEELKRPHVTLQRLFEEYRESNPSGLSRSSFFRFMSKHLKNTKLSMRQYHEGGQTLYSDYSGNSLSYIDKNTGEQVSTQLFVCSWGASSYCYIEARHTQNKSEFCAVHKNAFSYFKVAPYAIVPDNCKSAVSKADRYDPVINSQFGLLCDHYKIAVLPARVRKPKDKAVVESNVLHIQEFILARLRNRQFISLEDLNAALWEELEIYNNRPMKDHGNVSRRQRFVSNDLPCAQPLPERPFTIAEVKDNVCVARDYHVQFNDHFYSVPFVYVGKRVQVRQTGNLVEIYYDNVRIACHQLSSRKRRFTTIRDHMPAAHKHMAGWSPGYFLDEAKKIGPATVEVVEIMLKRIDHLQHAYRSVRGLLSLAKNFTPERLEQSCKRAIFFKNISSATIKTILRQGIDKQPLVISPAPENSIVVHENIRGQLLFTESTHTTYSQG